MTTQRLDALLHGAASAQRRAIAKAITLLESTRADHRAQADELLTGLLPHTGKAFRLGISGVPYFVFDRRFGVSGSAAGASSAMWFHCGA